MIAAAKRLWRFVYWAPQDLILWARLGFPARLIYFGGRGYGDTLLLGTVAHELRKRGLRTALLAEHPDLMRGSPDVSGVLPLARWRASAAVVRFGGRSEHLPYYLRPCPPTHDEPANHHIIVEMCRRAGVRGTVDLRTYFYLTKQEKAAGALRPRQAVVQALNPDSENIAPLKIYPPERLAAVVQATAGELDWVQIGGRNDPALPGALDLRGRTSVRESAAILSHSRVFLGPLGFLMHLARAVECRSAVIVGGRELPEFGSYSCNENFYHAMPCAPCYRRSTSLAGLACMAAISVDEVVAGVRRVAAKFGEPLPVDSAEVPEHATPFPLPWLNPTSRP